VRETPRPRMRHEAPDSSVPPTLVVSVSPTHTPVSRLESPKHVDERLVPLLVPADEQPKSSLTADLIKSPELVYLKAQGMSLDQRLKLAGQIAAEVLKRYPHLIQQLGSTNDPVPAWTILRNVVMRQLEQRLLHEPAPERHAL
jgi:hypothetical protein